ncbi:MAG: hypothetical protein ACYC1F_05605 [Gallionellaceae bacterium]
MWKYLATPMLALILCINHAVADDTTRETSLDHCAILTWPDGHQSRVDDFVEAPQFADACALKSGCKIDGHEFSSISQLKNALSNATMKCLFPPASTLNKGECAEQHDSFVKELRSLTPSLSNACQRIFLDPRAPIFPSIEKQCAASNEPDKNWCLARRLATYYLKNEQQGEFANIQQILLQKCPSPQLREYLKLRLYYLATQFEPGQLVGGTYATDFDFGPVDRQLLGPIRAHILYNLEGKEYEMAVEIHHPRKPRFFNRIETQCQKAQQGAPRDAPQAARP